MLLSNLFRREGGGVVHKRLNSLFASYSYHFCVIKVLVHREEIRVLNGKTIDLDWYYSRPNQKLKFLIRDLLFMPFCE